MADPDIFISYSRRHERLVTPLVKLLTIGNRLVFQDITSIELGSKWDETIIESLSRAKTVIIIWCWHASLSEWVRKEAELATSQQKAIIPVSIDKTPLPDFLKTYQGINLSKQVYHNASISDMMIVVLDRRVRHRIMEFLVVVGILSLLLALLLPAVQMNYGKFDRMNLEVTDIEKEIDNWINYKYPFKNQDDINNHVVVLLSRIDDLHNKAIESKRKYEIMAHWIKMSIMILSMAAIFTITLWYTISIIRNRLWVSKQARALAETVMRELDRIP
jgi:hypothetical protein